MPKIEKDPNNEKLPEELQRVLKDLVDQYEKEDSWVRKQQIKLWKKNDEFWHGIQFIFWSESRQDWISPTETRWFQQEEGREEAEGPFYDFVINIYKAHGESIIAALSSQVPSVRFPPDDPDDEEDLIASRTFAKIADLIQRHNNAKQVLIRALFTLWNQGIVAAYHAPKSDKNFGKIQIPQYKNSLTCENCSKDKPIPEDGDDEGMTKSFENISSPPNDTEQDFGVRPRENKDNEDEGSQLDAATMPKSPVDKETKEGSPCPTCGMPMVMQPMIDGFSTAPKSRVMIDLYGPLHVKVPYYARDQKECGYLILSVDQPKAFLKSLYPHVSKEIDQDYTEIGQYERMARTPSSFSSYSRVDENRNLSTLRRIWFRPWVFDGLPETKEKEKKELKKLFPQGCYCAFIGTKYVESRDEDVDKYWTIGQAGLAQYIHSDAVGQPLVSVQELRNVLVNLTQETIEHGIPWMGADTEVLDFQSYSRHEARPGFIYPLTPKPGQTINESFYESDRATVSKEVQAFGAQLDADGQFVVGDFPAVYGGPGQGKSRTFSEYKQSGDRALQRLSIIWSFVVDWWAHMMEKCVHLYVENMVEDERYVQKENNNYVNVWIRRAELTGDVGEVETEASETFPMSTVQKQSLIRELFQLNNEFINAALFDTENRKIIADAMAFTEIKIPGENQRIKQMREIQQMLKGQWVEIEPAVDDDEIHISTLKNFMVDDVGLDAKNTNPQGYQMLVQHLMMHQQAEAQKTQNQFEASAPGQPPEGIE